MFEFQSIHAFYIEHRAIILLVPNVIIALSVTVGVIFFMFKNPLNFLEMQEEQYRRLREDIIMLGFSISFIGAGYATLPVGGVYAVMTIFILALIHRPDYHHYSWR